jgi:hypothetical protein
MNFCTVFKCANVAMMSSPPAFAYIEPFTLRRRPLEAPAFVRHRSCIATKWINLRRVRLQAEGGNEDSGLKGTLSNLDQLLGVPSKSTRPERLLLLFICSCCSKSSRYNCEVNERGGGS